jgi:phosphate/sulfate permease
MMGSDAVVGVVLIAVALAAVFGLTFWSRRIIERIHAQRPGSLRQIEKDITNG